MSDKILVGFDWESYYSSKDRYSLRVMDTPAYLLDPRFETHMVAIKINDEKTFPVDAPDLPKLWPWLGDPEKIIMYGHNLLFDACLGAWHYGFVPGFMICTLALARQTIAKDLRRLDLDSVAKHLGVGRKGTTIDKVDGMRRADIIAAGRWQEYLDYSCLDMDLSHGILNALINSVPAGELQAADVALRMAVQPSFVFDRELLAQYYTDVVNTKAATVANAMAGITDEHGNPLGKASLMSNQQFADLLRSLGVEPPTKISATTNEETYAFAKSDDGMKELLEHHDPTVQAIVAARLAVKTTQEETRAARFYNCAGLRIPARGITGLFPVPLKISGAHTHRFSGDWKYNAQNLPRNKPRLGPELGKSKLRWSICAPPDHKIIVADSKQIEARMAATFCGQWDLVDQFRTGQDPYSIMATKVFGFLVTKANEGERFVGKQLVLQCQYGSGPPKFHANIRHVAKEQAGIDLNITLADAENYISTYRRETHEITKMRDYLNKTVIPMMTDPRCDFMLGPVRVMFERIVLPGGLSLYYKNLRYAKDPKTDEWSWIFEYQGRIKRLYGGKLLENIVQALAQVAIKQIMARLRPLFLPYDIRMALQAHDELAVVTPVCNIDYTKYHLTTEMKRPLDWMPLCPIDADVSEPVDRYGEAK